MIDRASFGVGLARFAIAARQPLDDATLAVYYEAMADEITAVEWEAFSRWALKSEIFDWIPRLDELTAALAKWRQDQKRRLPEPPRVTREEFRRGYEGFKRELDARGIKLDSVGLTLGKAATETVKPPVEKA